MSSADSDDDDHGCASTMRTSEVSGPSSKNSDRKRKSMSGSVFKAWSFQLTLKSDLGQGTASEEKERLLTARRALARWCESRVGPHWAAGWRRPPRIHFRHDGSCRVARAIMPGCASAAKRRRGRPGARGLCGENYSHVCRRRGDG
jgi:hypothetical protein